MSEAIPWLLIGLGAYVLGLWIGYKAGYSRGVVHGDLGGAVVTRVDEVSSTITIAAAAHLKPGDKIRFVGRP